MAHDPSITDLQEKINSLTFELETLKQENKELNSQLRSSRISMAGEWSIDLKTSEVSWSDGMYDLLNVKKDIAPDMKIFYKKLPRECSDQLNGAIQSVFITRKDFSFEHDIIFDENKILNVKTEMGLLLDDDSKPLKIEGVTSDITSIKSARQELERLSLIAAKTTNAVVILNTDCKIDWINSGFTMMTGYRIEEVLREPFKAYLYSNNTKFSDPEYLSNQMTKYHSINEELRLKTKLKKELWVHINISPILNYELNPVSYIFIMSDITKQRMVEEELRQTEKMAALGKLSAGLAHELNNPAAASLRATDQLHLAISDLQNSTVELAKIKVDAKYWDSITKWTKILLKENEQNGSLTPLEVSDAEETMMEWFDNRKIEQGWKMAPVFVQQGTKVEDLKKIASDYPPDLIESVFHLLYKSIEVDTLTEQIEKSMKSISGIVNVVKSYSFMDQAAVQSVNLHDGIRDTLKILDHKITTEIEIDLQFQNDLPKIQVIGSELNQVWTNIIDNAIDAVEGKGSIIIRTSTYLENLKVEIEDSGIGIPEKINNRIFDPFFTTKEVGEGTGLGLDIVRRIIVNRIGGSIDFKSKPGKTVFTVLIPFNMVDN